MLTRCAKHKAQKADQRRNRVVAFSLALLIGLISFAFYQWDETQKNTINALAETSDTFLSHRQLKVATAMQLDRQIRNAIFFQDDAGSQTVSVTLQQTTYNVQERDRLQGHSRPVSSVAFSPDGKTLASGSYDSSVTLWDVATGREIITLNGHSRPVSSVAFSPDGKTLVSGSYDNSVKLWDIATGKEITTLNGHSRPVSSVVFSPDGKTLVSGSYDNSVKLWNVATGEPLIGS